MLYIKQSADPLPASGTPPTKTKPEIQKDRKVKKASERQPKVRLKLVQ
jgi:hypothetical protein